MKVKITDLENFKTIKGVPEEERETHINFLHKEQKCILYTRDNSVATKLKKKAMANMEEYEVYAQEETDGSIVSYEFMFPKKYLRFGTKSKKVSRTYTEEERKAIGDRFRKSKNV